MKTLRSIWKNHRSLVVLISGTLVICAMVALGIFMNQQFAQSKISIPTDTDSEQVRKTRVIQEGDVVEITPLPGAWKAEKLIEFSKTEGVAFGITDILNDPYTVLFNPKTGGFTVVRSNKQVMFQSKQIHPDRAFSIKKGERDFTYRVIETKWSIRIERLAYCGIQMYETVTDSQGTPHRFAVRQCGDFTPYGRGGYELLSTIDGFQLGQIPDGRTVLVIRGQSLYLVNPPASLKDRLDEIVQTKKDVEVRWESIDHEQKNENGSITVTSDYQVTLLWADDIVLYRSPYK